MPDIRIVSLIPKELSRDRDTLGQFITKLLFSIVASRLGESALVLFREGVTVTDLDAFMVAAAERAPEIAAEMEAVIIDQTSEVGAARMMSSKVVSRCVWLWEQQSVDSIKRFMSAEGQAADRFNGLRPAPLNDPLNRPAKEAFVAELRLLRPRFRNHNGSKRTHRDLVFEFRDAVNRELFPMLAVTLDSWLSFWSLQEHQHDLRAFATKGRIGYATIVDAWFSRYKGHTLDYTRQMLSTRAS
jgi:hypothetical protein